MTTDQLSEVRTLLQRAQTAPNVEAALDILCQADPDLALKLFAHRRETMRAGGLVIR